MTDTDEGHDDGPKMAALAKSVGIKPEAETTSEPDTGADDAGERAEKAPVEKAEKPEPREAKDPKDRVVPHGALHEEREKRKQEKARADQLEQRLAQQEETLKRILKKEEEAKIPSFETDPAGNLLHTQRQTAEELAAIKKQMAGQTEQQQRAQQIQGFAQRVARDENVYRKEKPDYDSAVDHLRAVRTAMYEDLGHTPEEVADFINGEAFSVAQRAYTLGVSPASLYYKIAERFGYKVKAPEQEEDEAQDAAEKKVATLARGAQNSSRMSGGASDGGGMTLTKLSQITDPAEFDKAWEQAKRAGVLG